MLFSRLSVNNFLTVHGSHHSSLFTLKLLFHFLLNTMPRFHTVLLILCNNDKLYLSPSEETIFKQLLSTFPDPYSTDSYSCFDYRFTTITKISLSSKLHPLSSFYHTTSKSNPPFLPSFLYISSKQNALPS